jgi:streptomycin 6-kinase
MAAVLDDLPDVVRRRALEVGAQAWLDALPELVASLRHEWRFSLGRTRSGGTEAFVAEATLADGTAAVLKLLVPGVDESFRHEITALELADGSGCAKLFRSDAARGALLLERLGAPLGELGLPAEQCQEILVDTAALLWRPAAGRGLPTGADKGRWLVDFIARLWKELGQPCAERTVAHALRCAERRIAAHDDARAVLVHGDVHAFNALAAGDGFKLIDPDGLFAEAEYDLGVILREDPAELEGDGRARAARLASRVGLDAEAAWEWGVVERVSSGLACTQLAIQPEGRDLLAVADRLSAS